MLCKGVSLVDAFLGFCNSWGFLFIPVAVLLLVSWCIFRVSLLSSFGLNSIAMGEWQDLAQSVFIGLIFSFLVAKLISMVISFREENLRVVRDEDLPLESVEPEESSTKEQGEMDTDLAVSKDEKSGFSGESSGAAENQALLGESLGDDDDDGGGDDDEEDDDWEGVESTELDEAFSAATAFVAAAAADRMSQKVSNDVQLQLYALYKIATEGPCSVPQPSALKMTARAKW